MTEEGKGTEGMVPEARKAAPDKPQPAASDALLPIWDRRVAALRRKGTTPRDIYGQNVMGIIFPKGARGKEVQKKVRFLWISHIFEQKHPMCPGFAQDMYEPVTPDVMKQLGIDVVTKDRTAEGVPKAGHDAVLYWCPEELAKQQDEILLEGAMPSRKLRERQEELFSAFAPQMDDRGGIGGFSVSRDEGELAEVAQAQRREMGTLFGSSPIPQYADKEK